MRSKNERTEAQLFLVTRLLNQMNLNYTDFVATVIIFGDVADMKYILWKHAVPLNF